MYEMYIGKVLFPVTPGKATIKVNGQNKTITLINEGEVNLIKTPGLTDIEIGELLLPAFQKYPFAVYRDGAVDRGLSEHGIDENGVFHGASYYLNKLEAWKKKTKPVHFKLTRTTPDGQYLLWDTDFDVTIEDYEILEDREKFGMDVCVKLNMKQYRHWGAKKLTKRKNGKYLLKPFRDSKDTPKSYTVKSGDTLLSIARKQLNDGSKRKKIYELNKKTIESAARKHGRKSSSNGHWIYKGTKLKLPG